MNIHHYEVDNYSYYIGKNQNANHELITSKERNENDYWIHASNTSSPHGIISNPTNDKLTTKTIKKACMIMKVNNEKLKKRQLVSFDITRLKHIVCTNIPGQVIVNQIIKKITI